MVTFAKEVLKRKLRSSQKKYKISEEKFQNIFLRILLRYASTVIVIHVLFNYTPRFQHSVSRVKTLHPFLARNKHVK